MILNQEKELEFRDFLNTLYTLKKDADFLEAIGNRIIRIVPSDQFEFTLERRPSQTEDGCSYAYPLLHGDHIVGFIQVSRTGPQKASYTNEEIECLNFLFSFIPLVFTPSRCPKETMEGFCTRYGLSQKEEAVLILLSDGFSNREIGKNLHIAEATVKRHLYNIFNKTGADTRTRLLFLLQHHPVVPR